MNKHDTTIRDGIDALLHAMHKLLASAEEETSVACSYIRCNEQNMAIGTAAIVEDLLERAMKLHAAVIALHSLRQTRVRAEPFEKT